MNAETRSPRYAVFFKTHFWDGFTRRQLERVAAHAKNAQIFVLIDETAGPIPNIDAKHVIRVTEATAVAYGLPHATTEASLFWYNTDYPHYIAFDQQPAFDYYVAMEYDVSVNIDLDAVVSRIAQDEVDYVGFPILKEYPDWPWFERHLEVYDKKDIVIMLSCIAFFSKRAMQMLRDRRLAMAAQFDSGELSFWPNNEAFLPTEIRLAGMRSATLAEYGSVRCFDWWPPHFEADLPALENEAFLHPVLEGERYIRSVLRNEPRFMSVFSARSPLRQRLDKMPADFYRPLVIKEFRRRLRAAVQRRMALLGLSPDWSQGATSPKAASRQN